MSVKILNWLILGNLPPAPLMMEILVVNANEPFYIEEFEDPYEIPPDDFFVKENEDFYEPTPTKRPTVAQLESVVEQLDSYLAYVLSDLDDYMRDIVKLRIGYYGRIYSHKEISMIIGKTAQNVRVAEQKAVAKLRNVKDYAAMLKIVSAWSEEITGMAEMAKIEISKTG